MTDEQIAKMTQSIIKMATQLASRQSTLALKGTPNSLKLGSSLQTTSVGMAAAKSQAQGLQHLTQSKQAVEQTKAQAEARLPQAKPAEAEQIRKQIADLTMRIKTYQRQIREAKQKLDKYLPRIMDALK